jgi:hypothetical protein
MQVTADGHSAPSNDYMGIALGHWKSAGWVNLTSASTPQLRLGWHQVGRQIGRAKAPCGASPGTRSHPSATLDWERLIRTVARNLPENRPQPLSSAQARASTPETAHLRRR